MQRKTLLTNWQAIILILLANTSSAVYFIPSIPVTFVNQDAWVAVIIATLIAIFFIFYPLAHLGRKYPGKTIIQYSESILGKLLGKITGFLLIYFFFQVHCWTIREFGELAAIFLPETPLLVFILLLSLITAYAVYNGIEVIGRCAELLFPAGIFALMVISLLTVKELDVSKIYPVMESDLLSLFKAVLTPLDWLSIGCVFGVITAFVNNKAKLRKIGFIAVGISGVILVVFSIINIMVFGVPFLKTITFPLLLLARMSIDPVLGRIEIFIIALWTSWLFIRAAVFSYATVLSLSQVLELADYRFLIVPQTFLAVAYSLYQYESWVEFSYLASIGQVFDLFFTMFIPLLLWLVSLIRSRV